MLTAKKQISWNFSTFMVDFTGEWRCHSFSFLYILLAGDTDQRMILGYVVPFF